MFFIIRRVFINFDDVNDKLMISFICLVWDNCNLLLVFMVWKVRIRFFMFIVGKLIEENFLILIILFLFLFYFVNVYGSVEFLDIL